MPSLPGASSDHIVFTLWLGSGGLTSGKRNDRDLLDALAYTVSLTPSGVGGARYTSGKATPNEEAKRLETRPKPYLFLETCPHPESFIRTKVSCTFLADHGDTGPGVAATKHARSIAQNAAPSARQNHRQFCDVIYDILGLRVEIEYDTSRWRHYDQPFGTLSCG